MAFIWPALLTFLVMAEVMGTQAANDLDFPTGHEQYLVISDDLVIPPASNVVEKFVHGSYIITFYKKNDWNDRCQYQIMRVMYNNEEVFKAKLGCLMTDPLGVVFTLFDGGVMVFKEANSCRKVEPKGSRFRSCSKSPCLALEDFPCQDDVSQQVPQSVDGIFTMLNKEEWTKPYLQSKIKLRLVPKTWDEDLTLEGRTAGAYRPLDIYPRSAEEAERILKETVDYRFTEMTLGIWAGNLDKVYQQATSRLDQGGKPLFSSSQPTIMIIHPISATGDSKFVVSTVKALSMMKLHRHNNIVVVDMADLSENMFMSVLNTATKGDPMFQEMAEALGDFFVEAIRKGYIRASDVHLIGWSYSATLAGYLGRYIQQQTSMQIGSIVALDPFGNAQINPLLQPVNAKDALKVHIHHSNAFPFGSPDSLGTADFTYNNGFIQPECVKSTSPVMCSHTRVVQRFWFVILFGNKRLFEARQCENHIFFNAGKCDHNPSVFMTYPITSNPARGNFFLKTLAEGPYGAGSPYSISDPVARAQFKAALEKNPHLADRWNLNAFLGLSWTWS